MTTHMTKTYWILGALALVALSTLLALNAYLRWHQDQYFGEIIRISASELVLLDMRVGERVFHITPETRIRRGGGREQATLTEGERIIVFGEERERMIEATLIRVVDDDDWNLPPLPDREY